MIILLGLHFASKTVISGNQLRRNNSEHRFLEARKSNSLYLPSGLLNQRGIVIRLRTPSDISSPLVLLWTLEGSQAKVLCKDTSFRRINMGGRSQTHLTHCVFMVSVQSHSSGFTRNFFFLLGTQHSKGKRCLLWVGKMPATNEWGRIKKLSPTQPLHKRTRQLLLQIYCFQSS